MKNKTIGLIMQTPLLLLVIASSGAGFYAAAKGLGISWIAPIIHLVIAVVYGAGRKIQGKKDKEQEVVEEPVY